MISKRFSNVILIFFIPFLFFIPLFTNNYQQYIINIILVNFLACLGLSVVLGYCGQFAFASAGFLGLGAYSTGLLMAHFDFPYLLALLIGSIISIIFAVFIGFVGLRLSRYYLAISTIAFTLIMRFIYINFDYITFGPSGFNIPIPMILGMRLNTDHKIYYIIMSIVLLMTIFIRNILKSNIGRAFMAIRESEEFAKSYSINVKYYKMLAFVFSGLLGGIAGGLYCIILGRITPDEFGMTTMMLHFMIVVLGGLGSLTGLIISCPIIIVLPELVRAFKVWEEVSYGLFLILVILFAPEGIYGIFKKYMPSNWREKLY